MLLYLHILFKKPTGARIYLNDPDLMVNDLDASEHGSHEQKPGPGTPEQFTDGLLAFYISSALIRRHSYCRRTAETHHEPYRDKSPRASTCARDLTLEPKPQNMRTTFIHQALEGTAGAHLYSPGLPRPNSPFAPSRSTGLLVPSLDDGSWCHRTRHAAQAI